MKLLRYSTKKLDGKNKCSRLSLLKCQLKGKNRNKQASVRKKRQVL